MKKDEPGKPKHGFKLRWHLSAIIGAILAAVLFGTFREKPVSVPADAEHRPLIDRLVQGGDVETVARGCLACHNRENIPLPKDHTTNEKCLACHPVPRGA